MGDIPIIGRISFFTITYEILEPLWTFYEFVVVLHGLVSKSARKFRRGGSKVPYPN